MRAIRKTTAGFISLGMLVLLLYLTKSADREKTREHARSVAQKMAEKVGIPDLWSKGPESTRLRLDFPFIPGQSRLKPPGTNYTRVIVLGKTQEESISWMDNELPNVERKVYIVNNSSATLHTPANKGNEAMVYLTYIIDHYDMLPDIMIFIHYHRHAWHNNALLNYDMAETIKRLNSERVVREGYMNLRCEWFPGCPNWIRPRNAGFSEEKADQFLISKSWSEIFPYNPVPDVLAQPCCSQFALSKDLVRSIEKERYIHYRNWILNTKLTDNWSGRVWEYLWHYAFTGQNYACPVEHVCHCDGYGICFGNADKYEDWVFLRKEREGIIAKFIKGEDQAQKFEGGLELGSSNAANVITKPEEGLDELSKKQIHAIKEQMNKIKSEAIQRGKDSRIRALESGLEWPPKYYT